MIDWLMKNREWVFSGAGVSMVVGLFVLARHFIGRKRKNGSTSVLVRFENLPTNGTQPNLAGSAAVAVERITPITADEMQMAIEAAPPLQRDAVANRYIGLRVEWDTELASAEENAGLVRLQLRAIRAERKFPSAFVWCNVSLADHRELAVLPEEAHIRVNGTIERPQPRRYI